MTETHDSTDASPFQNAPEFLTDTLFDSFDLPVEVKKGLKDAGFISCSPIQAKTIPVALAGHDVAGQAQTGTGKTAAFLVPLFTRLLSTPRKKTKNPLALIVAPTRELAAQIHDETRSIGRHTGFKTMQIVGGVDYQKQADALKKGCDIVICTPGRIIDYHKQRIFNPHDIEVLVIDEADRLLDLGFAKDMRYILSKLPSYEKRLSMLFSATLSYREMELTYEYMNMPEFIAVAPEAVTVRGIDQELFHVGAHEKLELLLGLLKREKWTRLLIFVNTKAGVEWVSQKLKGNGWPAEGITGDIPQRKRFRLMDQFKSGRLKILVATDVASRGLHVDNISHVVNYDLPQDSESYVHRIGRTARAGKTGKAISLACERYVYHLDPLEEMLGYKLPVQWPDEDWFEKDQCGPVATSRDLLKKRSMRRQQRTQKTKTGPSRHRRPVLHRKQTFSVPRGECPGSFFGFKKAGDANVEEAPPEKTPEKTPEKKHRRRRKKKQSRPAADRPVKSESGKDQSEEKPSEKNQAGKSQPEKKQTAKTRSGKSQTTKTRSGKSQPGKSQSEKSQTAKKKSVRSRPKKSETKKKDTRSNGQESETR
ncbi:MAG: RNA helicase [Deltaproteobacteria bacterium]|nr:MAG: RNA helicase [Deltaproteobacteria bacterium]